MKLNLRKYTLIFCSALLISFSNSAIAQITGGGSNSNTTTAKKAVVKKKKQGFKGMTISLAAPTGKFNKYSSTASFEEAYGASTGVVVSSIFNRTLTELSNGVKIGLNHTISGSIYKMDSEYKTNFPSISITPPIFIEYKLGPSATFIVSELIKIDAYFGIGPVFSFGATFYDSGNFDISATPAFGIKTSLGVQIRISNLILGMSIHPGKLNYTYSDSIGSSSEEQFRISVSNFRLAVGFVF